MAGQIVIYVRLPSGYEEYDEAGRLLFWFLLKVYYGLRQFPRLWYLEFAQFLAAYDFLPLPADPFVLKNPVGDLLVM